MPSQSESSPEREFERERDLTLSVELRTNAGRRLIALARAGERWALDALVLHFQPLLEAYVRKHAGARLLRYMSVEDLCQEILTRGVGGLNHLQDQAETLDFQRLLLQHARWVLQKRGEQAGGFLGESIDGGATPLEQSAHEPMVLTPKSKGDVTRNDEAAWVRILVTRLEEKYRSVVELMLDGATPAQIAAKLQLEEATVYKRILRGAKMLKALTNPEEKPDKAT